MQQKANQTYEEPAKPVEAG